jgi:hypothetical protein
MRSIAASLFLCLLAATGLAACADSSSDNPEETEMSEAALSNNEQTAFNYFVSKGLTKVQAAGIVGNLIQESTVIPTAVEYGGGPGRGIAQWSVGGRWDTSYHDNVTWYANAHGKNRWALGTQLDFIWYELTTYGYGYSSLKSATTVSAATIAFEDKYEICGNCQQAQRIAYANQVLSAYGGGGSSGEYCYSGTLGKQMPPNACVQSKYDGLWYQCSNGSWVDRWTDPDPCNGVHPL